MCVPNTWERGSGTVLVVEDNPNDTLLLHIAAQEVCPDVAFHFVANGYQALAYLRGEGEFADRQTHPFPNLVLLDLRLPGMDGFQVLKAIRALAECEHLKVLAWSDGLDPGIGARAQAAGVEHFVSKPFSFDQLLEEVSRVCALARG
jgi:CheY-like chemotaxis protein